MSKAIEEKKNRKLRLYWKFMRTDKSNDKNKTKFPPASTPVTVLLIAENY